MVSFVYFLRPIGMNGPIKIGCSAKPHLRLAAYFPWSPYPLEIAATIPGDERLERRFHAKFVDDHTHHEWFRWSFDMYRTICEVRDGTFDVATLPEPRDIRIKGWISPASIDAGRNVRRVNKMLKAGSEIPDEVMRALHTYEQPPELVAHRRKVVREFLAAQSAQAA